MHWNTSRFTVGMPHMVPNQLSEVELLKLVGDRQWRSVAEIVGRPSSEIVNEFDERLYASFINVELDLAGRSLLDFDEDTEITLRNRAAFYGQKFVEGLTVFDSTPPEDVALVSVVERDDLTRLGHPWVYMTNAFVTRAESNSRLRVFAPAGLAPVRATELATRPPGITEHEAVQSTGEIPDFGSEPKLIPLRPVTSARIVYRILPESDLNGAGLLYFARYVTAMNYAERIFLGSRLAHPLSTPLIRFLTTVRRRIYYFANADPADSIDIRVSAGVSPGTDELRFTFRHDLYRDSDGTLMASSLASRSLRLPPGKKSLLTEAERFLTRSR